MSNTPSEFKETVWQITDDEGEAVSVLLYYAPVDMHMLIEAFLKTLTCQPANKLYDHIMLVGEFCVWAKDSEVQHG